MRQHHARAWELSEFAFSRATRPERTHEPPLAYRCCAGGVPSHATAPRPAINPLAQQAVSR